MTLQSMRRKGFHSIIRENQFFKALFQVTCRAIPRWSKSNTFTFITVLTFYWFWMCLGPPLLGGFICIFHPHLCLSSCSPWFESHAHHLRFYSWFDWLNHLYCILWKWKKLKINQNWPKLFHMRLMEIYSGPYIYYNLEISYLLIKGLQYRPCKT